MHKPLLHLLLGVAISAASVCAGENPNIVLIYADDLGYGDVGCYGSTDLKTPNIDRLAMQGLRFTDAHSTSATCTPSRYSLLTGEYAWRRKGTNILPGNAPLIIAPGRATLASVLQKAGYHTGIVGKWHLGLGDGDLNWNGDIQPGPQETGFNDAFIMAATGDRVPCTFVENHHMVGIDPNDPVYVNYKSNFPGEPTGKENPELLKLRPTHTHNQSIVNGIPRIGFMTGGKSALWNDENLGDTFLEKAVEFINKNKDRRFFLYYATHEPHVPRVPHPRFAGKSALGPRGDVILQLDDAVGKILDTLEDLHLAQNTLVIFSSDNGPILDDGYADQSKDLNGEHRPSGPWRGNKYSTYEAGTRVPFIVSWPAHVKPGVSDALMSQVDLMASLAALTGQTFHAATAPDSENHLPALLGNSPVARQSLVEQGGPLGLRLGGWKFIPRNNGPRLNPETKTETGSAPEPQLFDLANDPGETTNLAASHPDKVEELSSALDKISTTRSP